MGNYTQFHASISMKKDAPVDVVMLIMHQIYTRDYSLLETITLPDHEFFKQERWDYIFMGPNFEHDHGAKLIRTKSGYYELEIHCDVNYGYDEVTEFVKWIAPWVAGRKKKKYIGWWKNENMDHRFNEYIDASLGIRI